MVTRSHSLSILPSFSEAQLKRNNQPSGSDWRCLCAQCKEWAETWKATLDNVATVTCAENDRSTTDPVQASTPEAATETTVVPAATMPPPSVLPPSPMMQRQQVANMPLMQQQVNLYNHLPH